MRRPNHAPDADDRSAGHSSGHADVPAFGDAPGALSHGGYPAEPHRRSVHTGRCPGNADDGGSTSCRRGCFGGDPPSSTCAAGPSDASGTVTCSANIGGASRGVTVTVDVSFTVNGQIVSGKSSFTPR